MPKISDEPLVRVEVRLFEADHEWLKTIYGDSTGASKALRTIVRAFINQAKARADAEINTNPITIPEGELDTILGGL